MLCKAYRLEKGLKHAQVAAAIGIAVTTYGNVESGPWKVISRARAERLATLYQLGDEFRANLLGAWERCPLSRYGEKRRAAWERMRVRRSKLKHYDRMKLSLVEAVSLVLSHVHGRSPCTCMFGGGTEYDATRNCEFCEALESLGIPADLDAPRLYERLARMAEELEIKLQIGSKHDHRTKTPRSSPDQG